MPTTSLHRRISLLIKAKRREDGLKLRAAADASGVSAATLSRLERGITPQLPDVATLSKLAAWLKMSVDELLRQETAPPSTEPQSTTPEVVEVHLRADKNLPQDTAEALANMFKVLYEQATRKPLG